MAYSQQVRSPERRPIHWCIFPTRVSAHRARTAGRRRPEDVLATIETIAGMRRQTPDDNNNIIVVVVALRFCLTIHNAIMKMCRYLRSFNLHRY